MSNTLSLMGKRKDLAALVPSSYKLMPSSEHSGRSVLTF